MKKTWFSIKAKADAAAEISIYDEIGAWGVNAKEFITELKALDAKELTLFINSPGGSVFDAIAIYNALVNSEANITVRIMGVAASAASYIAMAGNRIIMPKNTFMMVHNPLGRLYGNADDMRDMADILDKIGASLTATYVARTGRSLEEVSAFLANETYMTATEAVANGFADELDAELKIAAAFDLDKLPEDIQAAFTGVAVPDKNTLGNTFAYDLHLLATQAGLSDYAGAWLCDAAITTLDQARAVIAEAREIHELCTYAKAPEMAARMIDSRTSLADARAQLCVLRAVASDAPQVSNIQPSSKKPPTPVLPAALKTADIWAARKDH